METVDREVKFMYERHSYFHLERFARKIDIFQGKMFLPFLTNTNHMIHS